MATSGSVYSSYADDSRFQVYWERTEVDTTNNRTKIKWTLYLVSDDYWYNNAVRINSIYINGTKVKDTQTWSNFVHGTYNLASDTLWITHNNDGTKTFSISLSGWFYSNSNVSGSGSFTLNTIDRAGVITRVPNFNLEDAVDLSISMYVSSFSHRLQTLVEGHLIDSRDLSFVSGGSVYGFSFTPTELSLVYSYVPPDSNTASVTFNLDTFNGSSQIGSTSTKTVTGTIQGAAWINDNGIWKRGIPWINDNGTWKRGVFWINDNGTWKRGA